MSESLESSLQASNELERMRWGEASSWILYDVANTVYAATITFVFSIFIAQNFGDVRALGITQTLSMVAAGLAVPFFAAIADRTGKAKLYLVLTSLICIGSMAAFALELPLAALMLFFGLANFTYQGALVFYNSLLPSVATINRAGLVSGLGTGLGYIGTLLVLVFALSVQAQLGTSAAFVATAALFFGLALPCFVVVRERRVPTREKLSRELLSERWGALTTTLKGLPKDRSVMWFLIGNFFCVDVLNTALLFFSAYSLAVYGGQLIDVAGISLDLRYYVAAGSDVVYMPDQANFLKVIGVLLNGLALCFGVVLGVLADRWGALPSLKLSAFFLMAAIFTGFLFVGPGFEEWEAQKIKDQASNTVVMEEAERASPEALQAQAATSGWLALESELSAHVSVADEEIRQARLQAREDAAAAGTNVDKLIVPELVVERKTPVSWFPLAYVLSLGILGGLGLAGIWTAGRKVLMEIAPREKLGEYFGLYGITTKVSVVGSTTFALIMSGAGARYAMIFQAIPLAFGIYCLSKVRSRASS